MFDDSLRAVPVVIMYDLHRMHEIYRCANNIILPSLIPTHLINYVYAHFTKPYLPLNNKSMFTDGKISVIYTKQSVLSTEIQLTLIFFDFMHFRDCTITNEIVQCGK